MNNLSGKLKCAESAPPVMLSTETGKGRFLMESRTYYYARVSSKEQNLDRQIAAFAALGAQEREIITDKESGKDLDRSGYTALKTALLRRGDTLVIKSLDRLSRSKRDIKNELQYFKENERCLMPTWKKPIPFEKMNCARAFDMCYNRHTISSAFR